MPVDPVPAFRTRLSVLFAADARVAVVLRRGPRRSFRLVSWDLATDTFVRGQWMRGVIELCDLSPDGSKLIYWAAQYHRTRRPIEAPFDPVRAGAVDAVASLARRKRQVPRYLKRLAGGRGLARKNTGTWTAISRPPFFTALAVWPAIGSWTGRGVFRSDRELILNETGEGLTAVENVPIPPTFRISSLAALRGEAAYRRSARAPAAADEETRQALLATGCRQVDWISRHDDSDLLFAADGRIYRLQGWHHVARARYLADARMLIDLSDDSFANIAPPAAALRW